MRIKELDHLIEESFGSEPDFLIPDDFAKKIMNELVRRTQWKADLVEYFNITSFLIFLLTIVAVTYYFVNKDTVIQVITLISRNLLQTIFIFLLVNFIFFADRVLLRFLFNRWRIKE